MHLEAPTTHTARKVKAWTCRLTPLGASALGLSLLAAGCNASPFAWPSGDPNIILFLIDSLRADHLGAYGYPRDTSPAIDRLARDGVVFQNAIAPASWTRPSMGSLFTSLSPHVHGATTFGKTLPAEAVTLAETLQGRKYFTTAFQTNPLVAGEHFAQGFDTYYEIFGASGGHVVRDFLTWLDEREKRKFFAYVHFMDVHLPYDAPDENRAKFVGPYSGQLDPRRIGSQKQIYDLLPTLTGADRSHIIDLYDAGINQVDDSIEFIVRELKRRKLFDDTIVIVTSDHGEELFDHGGFEHGHSMHREVVQVPLIIRNPRLPARGVRVKQLVRLIDVFPTVLGFLRVDIPAPLMGRDLGPAIADPNLDWNLEGFSEGVMYGPNQAAIQKGPLKMIQIDPAVYKFQAKFFERLPPTPGWTAESGAVEFFNLETDPNELHPVAGHPMEPAWGRLLAGYRAAGVSLAGAPEPIDEKRMEQLKSLGYIR